MALAAGCECLVLVSLHHPIALFRPETGDADRLKIVGFEGYCDTAIPAVAQRYLVAV